MKSIKYLALLLPAMLLSAGVSAQEINGADTAWILTSTALVLFMTIPGLSLFYAGLCVPRTCLSVLMQCFALTCLMSLVWFAVGYTIAFGSEGVEQGKWIGDFGNIFFAKIGMDSVTGTVPSTLFAIFQMTFAIITPALIVGGFAERMRFSAMLLFSTLWLIFVYSPICHWVWGGGWLGEMGLQDFAGGTVVHITAAVAALVAAVMMGPRRGFGTVAMPPHNLTLTVAGAGMLWVGWFGFNAGQRLRQTAVQPWLCWLPICPLQPGRWPGWRWNGCATASPLCWVLLPAWWPGLGTITPASGSVGPAAAVVIGLTAGVVCYFATNYLKNKLKVDDSLDVFPVHGVGGILGTLLAGIFCSTQLGIFSGNGFSDGISSIGGQLMVQGTGVISTLLYTAVMTFILLKIVGALVGLRVDDDEETQGLDLVLHDERGYDL